MTGNYNNNNMDDDNNRHNNNNMNPKTYNINLSSTRIEPTRTINMNIPFKLTMEYRKF